MWIRSKDKGRLGDYRFIFVVGTTVKAETQMDIDALGEYETKERAIEVLDEIQKHLVAGSKYDTLHSGRRNMHEKVFNMPEE